MTTAFVLAGGGSLGAVQVGMLQALGERGVTPDLLPGASLTADELTDSCREHIANYKLPRTIEIVDALPVSGAGKILKRELRARHWAGGRRVN